MTEYNLFCYSKEYNDGDSFQQVKYRVFNKAVGIDRYNELQDLIKGSILKDFKLELNKNSWKDKWKKLSDGQIKRLQAIPEFNAEVFRGITDLEIPESKTRKIVKIKLSNNQIIEVEGEIVDYPPPNKTAEIG